MEARTARMYSLFRQIRVMRWQEDQDFCCMAIHSNCLDLPVADALFRLIRFVSLSPLTLQ